MPEAQEVGRVRSLQDKEEGFMWSRDGIWVLGSGTSDDGRFDMRTSGVFRELNLSPSCQPIRAEEASRG